jgi:energy-coupling factor transport system permease protein
VKTDRPIHAGAWWLWAAGVAVAGVATSNPLLLLALCTLSIMVATLRGRTATAATSIGAFIKIAVFVVAARVVLQILFGQRSPGHVLFTIPSVQLPSWLAGVSLGGPVTAEAPSCWLLAQLIAWRAPEIFFVRYRACSTKWQ